MLKLGSVFASLDAGRQVLVILAALGLVVTVFALARTANAPTMSLLYSGLEPASAGEVIQSLEQMGAIHEVRGDSIFVDASQRDSLRMALAAEGKPSNSAGGYEILDNLSGFGTTSQMFSAAYWRAKEGELARTILANPQIRAARVHISNPENRPFSSRRPGSASVVITTGQGAISSGHAQALRFLVASAVSGLSPDQVTVIDAQGGMIGSADSVVGGMGSAPERAASLRRNVERLLEARVGSGRAIVEVNIDPVTEHEEIVERVFDPDTRVAISTVTEETSSTASDDRGGAVTVAGNLPDGDAGGSGAQSSSQQTETREQVNFEVSETQREVLRAPGGIRRLSVAVLVDGLVTTAEDGSTTWAPRPEDELTALRDLVASAVGFDPARGDEITLRSMQFPPVPELGTEAPAVSVLDRLGVDMMRLIQLGVLSAVALVLGLFVVRPILSGSPAQIPQSAAPLDLPPPGPTPEELPALGSDAGDGQFLPQIAIADDIGIEGSEPASPMSLGDPVERLRRVAEGRQDETAMILRGWVEDNGETV